MAKNSSIKDTGFVTNTLNYSGN